MSHDVFQRDRYDGVARKQAVWWTLRREATKGEAVCRMFTHIFGHELRLEVEEQLGRSVLLEIAPKRSTNPENARHGWFVWTGGAEAPR